MNQQTILISGATGAIGELLSCKLATQGIQTILLSSNAKKLKTTAEKILTQGGLEPWLCCFDLAQINNDRYLQLSEEVKDMTGTLDGIVHCAAKFNGLTPLASTDIYQFQQTIHTNLCSRFALTQQLLPSLLMSQNPKVIFSSSTLAIETGQAYWGAYQIAETANAKMIEVFEAELENKNITFHNVLLPQIDTPLHKKAYPFVNSGAKNAEYAAQKLYQVLQP